MVVASPPRNAAEVIGNLYNAVTRFFPSIWLHAVRYGAWHVDCSLTGRGEVCRTPG
jgi:hypothetical protein